MQNPHCLLCLVCNLGPRAKRNISRFVSLHFSPNIRFMSKTKQHNIYLESTKFPWNIHEFEFYAFPSFMSSLFVFFSSIVSNVSNFVSECFCICAVFCLNISVFTFARTGGQLGPPHKCQILLALWKGAHHQIINLFKEIKVVIACLCWDLICYLRVVGGSGVAEKWHDYNFLNSP